MLRSDRKKRVIADEQADILETADGPVEVEVPCESSSTPASHAVQYNGTSNSEISNSGASYRKRKSSDGVELGEDTAKDNSGSLQSIPVANSAADKELQPPSSKRDATAAELSDRPSTVVAEPSLSVSWRSSYDNPEKRQTFENGKFKEAVSYLHEQIKSGKATRESLFLKFNYPSCYDIEFLKLLAQELNADISGIFSKKRVAHKDVLNEFISKLI